MFRRDNRKDKQYTRPDHRPMLPEFRGPQDPTDMAVREVRRRFEESNSNKKIIWR